MFRARARPREFAVEADRLLAQLDQQHEQMERLGVLETIQLEARKVELRQNIEQQTLRLQREQQEHSSRLEAQMAEQQNEYSKLQGQIEDLRGQIVETQETALLQEAEVYEYRHPLDDAVAYQAELARLKDSIKTMTRKDGGAVLASTSWTVNGSATEGRAMVRDFSKLLLRAYNAEADNLVRSMKPYKLDSAIDRLSKVATTIAKLGTTMNIRISPKYKRLRVKESELTADYLEKISEEREREREEKARLRDEKKAQQELERDRARLIKERQHYQNVFDTVIAKGDEAAASRLRGQLDEIDKSIEDVDYRAANVRAGYVYVISNIGSFGQRMVKIGITRRLEPYDRVRELSDASVPFNFDIHALFFSQDAVGIEAQIHERMADQRVNLINRRREFFYATPAETKEHLLALAGDLLHFEENPEALEYRQSQNEQRDQDRPTSLGPTS